MPKLYIVRGLPGSGKSTYAKDFIYHANDELFEKIGETGDVSLRKQLRSFKHWEADMFFETATDYTFDPRLLRVAHQWCYANVVKDLRISEYDVVVSNTFTRMQEMAKYLEIHDVVDDVEIEIIEIKTQFESIHNVPKEKFDQMKARWEEIPPELELKITTIGGHPTDDDLDAYNEERLVSIYDKSS